MSIIIDTLSRLEKDQITQTDKGILTSVPSRNAKPLSVPIGILLAAVLTIFAGTGVGVLAWDSDYLLENASMSGHADAEGNAPAENNAVQLTTYNQAHQASEDTEPPHRQQINPQPDSKPEPKPEPKAESKPAPKPAPKPTPKPAQQQTPALPVPPSTAVDEAVELGRIALSRGQYEQALRAVDALHPVPEPRADLWLIKGSAHLGLGQLDRAESAFASAHSLAPNNVQIAVQRAIIKQEKGDHPEAVKLLQDAAALHPDVPEVHLNLGYSQLTLGAMRDAKSSFRIFLRLTEGRSLYKQQRQAVNEWLAQFP